jgi:hypothetical protein
MENLTGPDDVEAHLRTTAVEMTAPDDGECVFCYVLRMLDAFGCDTTLRWATRWRDVRMPRATALERRLGGRGGFCDCEIFLNGWNLVQSQQVCDEHGELNWPRERPPCAGGRYSQPCAHWEPRRRPRGSWEW